MENQLTKLILEYGPINGWESDMCSMSGTLSWSNEDSDCHIYGTPGWENENGYTPIDMSNDATDDYTHICTLETNEDNGTVEEHLATYISKITEIVSHIETELETIK